MALDPGCVLWWGLTGLGGSLGNGERNVSLFFFPLFSVALFLSLFFFPLFVKPCLLVPFSFFYLIANEKTGRRNAKRVDVFHLNIFL